MQFDIASVFSPSSSSQYSKKTSNFLNTVAARPSVHFFFIQRFSERTSFAWFCSRLLCATHRDPNLGPLRMSGSPKVPLLPQQVY